MLYRDIYNAALPLMGEGTGASDSVLEEKAKELFDEFFVAFGKREVQIERYYDHFMASGALSNLFKPGNNSKKPIII